MPKTQVWNSWRQTCLSIAQGCQSCFVVPWFDQTSTSKWWICWACVSQEWIRIGTDDRFFLPPNVFGMWRSWSWRKGIVFYCMYILRVDLNFCAYSQQINQYLCIMSHLDELWWKCQRCGMNITLGGSFGNHCHGWCGYSSFDASCHGNVFDSAFILEFSWIIQNEFLHACNSWCGQSFHALQVPLASLGGLWASSSSKLFSSSPRVMRPPFYMQFEQRRLTLLLKSMWNIDFDDDTMVIPACVQFCLHSHTVAWWTYRGLNTYVYFCFLLFLLFLLLLIFCSCSCCCPCLLSLLLLCSSVLLCCIFLGCFYLYLLLLFFGCCALMVVCRFVWVCACYHAPDLCCHTLCLDPRCSALLHLNMNALNVKKQIQQDFNFGLCSCFWFPAGQILKWWNRTVSNKDTKFLITLSLARNSVSLMMTCMAAAVVIAWTVPIVPCECCRCRLRDLKGLTLELIPPHGFISWNTCFSVGKSLNPKEIQKWRTTSLLG